MEYRAVKDLKKLGNNPRKITGEDLAILEKSVKDNPDYFEARPLILSDRTGELIVIAGSQRLEVAKKLKMKTVPTFLIKNLTEEREREITIRDNVNNGEWDLEKLADEWERDELLGWRLPLDEELGDKKEVVEDPVPEVDNDGEIDSKMGKIYRLGRHLLLCGDSNNADGVNGLFATALKLEIPKAKLLFTSPPYNNAKCGFYEDYKDNKPNAEYVNWNIEVATKWKDYLDGFLCWNLSYNTSSGGSSIEIFYRLINELELKFIDWIIWNKKHAIPIKKRLNHVAESILSLANDTEYEDIEVYADFNDNFVKYYNRTAQQFTNVITLNLDNNDNKSVNRNVNAATFPVALPAKFVQMMTLKDEVVMDPFGGTGSTLMACEQLGRTCLMAELSERECDIIRKRYYIFTHNGDSEGWQNGTKAVE